MIERHVVVGVLGCSGGVGASTFAAVLACVAGSSTLVDVDVSGGGIDVLLGIDDVPGVRWSGVRVGGGHLDPQLLASGLPRWGPCSVLAADVGEVRADALRQVVDAARTTGPVVLDISRSESSARAAGLAACDLVVLVVRSDVVGIAAAHAVARSLPEFALGIVVRRGHVASAEAARLLGVPVLGVLPALRPATDEPNWRRLPRASVRVAAGIIDGLRSERDAA